MQKGKRKECEKENTYNSNKLNLQYLMCLHLDVKYTQVILGHMQCNNNTVLSIITYLQSARGKYTQGGTT